MKFLVIFLLFVGCGGPKNAAGGYEADMRKGWIFGTNTEVVSPIPKTLYIVLDPTKVADDIKITNSKDTIIHFRDYFGIGIKTALKPYFEKIEVVAPGFVTPEDHIIAEVKLDEVAAHEVLAENDNHTTFTMRWSITFRPDQETEAVFSYTGMGESTASKKLEDTTWRMIQSATDGLRKEWTDKNVYQTLKTDNANEPISKEL